MLKVIKTIVEYSPSIALFIGASAFFYMAIAIDIMFAILGIVLLLMGAVLGAMTNRSQKNVLSKIDIKDGHLLIEFTDNGQEQKLYIKLDDIKNIKYELTDKYHINIECIDEKVYDISTVGITRGYLYTNWKLSNIVSMVQRYINKQSCDDLIKTEKLMKTTDLIVILIVIIVPLILIFLATR